MLYITQQAISYIDKLYAFGTNKNKILRCGVRSFIYCLEPHTFIDNAMRIRPNDIVFSSDHDLLIVIDKNDASYFKNAMITLTTGNDLHTRLSLKNARNICTKCK